MALLSKTPAQKYDLIKAGTTTGTGLRTLQPTTVKLPPLQTAIAPAPAPAPAPVQASPAPNLQQLQAAVAQANDILKAGTGSTVKLAQPAATPNPGLMTMNSMVSAAPSASPSFLTIDDLKKKYGSAGWNDSDYQDYLAAQNTNLAPKKQSADAARKALEAAYRTGGAGMSLDDYLKERARIGGDSSSVNSAENPLVAAYRASNIKPEQANWTPTQWAMAGPNAQNYLIAGWGDYQKNFENQYNNYLNATKGYDEATGSMTSVLDSISARAKARNDAAAAQAYQAQQQALGQNGPLSPVAQVGQQLGQQAAPATPGTLQAPGLQQEAPFTPRNEEQVRQVQDLQDTVSMWESIFGRGEQQAYQAASTSLDHEIAGLQRRQQELSAASGRSATGGGYQAGAAQAALSAGGKKAGLVSDFYQNRQSKKQGFLQSQLDRAEREGRAEDARQLSLLLANIELEGSLGNAEAMSEYYNRLLGAT